MRTAAGLALASLLLPLVTSCATEDDAAIDDGQDDSSDQLSSDDPDRLGDVPFYFAIPKSSVNKPIAREKFTFPTVWNTSLESPELGLRVIAVQQGDGIEARKQARRAAADQLAAAGVLLDGDVVLTFRPELARTMAYPHIQMGVTHAGLVFTQNGKAFNIDSPLDTDHVGKFDAPHYAGGTKADGSAAAGTDALHIIRPRAMNDSRRAQLRDWIGLIKSNQPRFNGVRAQVKFQPDYLTPAFASSGLDTRQTVTVLGKIILEQDTTTKLPMYCSEFAWHMIALSACTPEEIGAAGEEGAECVDPPFDTMPLVEESSDEVGIGGGPLIALLQLAPADRAAGILDIFAALPADKPEVDSDARPNKLSSGHRKVAEQVKGIFGPLMKVYQTRASGATAEQTAAIAAAINGADLDGPGPAPAGVPENYSPTAFLIASMLADSVRTVDYIATIGFVDAAGFAKARQRAAQGGLSADGLPQ
jgi:hypothetical protein